MYKQRRPEKKDPMLSQGRVLLSPWSYSARKRTPCPLKDCPSLVLLGPPCYVLLHARDIPAIKKLNHHIYLVCFRTIHGIRYRWVIYDLINYLKKRESIAKDEIHRTFNVTILVIMPTQVVIKCVLCSQKSTPQECCCICWYSKCHCLFSNCPRCWYWGCVLHQFSSSVRERNIL